MDTMTPCPGWISVHDSLPPRDDRLYPVKFNVSVGSFVSGREINDEYKISYEDVAEGCWLVTHWLDHPLPTEG